MLKTFDEIKDEVFALANTDEEIDRLYEELDLFEERGWNNYVAFTVNYLKEMTDKVRLFFPYLSAMDSLFINKALYPNQNFDYLLNKKHSKDILFNDAFRLGVRIVCADPIELNYLNHLSAVIFEEFLKMSRLYSFARGVPDKEKVGLFDHLVCAISSNRVPKDDFEVIFNEEKDGPRDEINVLSKYLIVYVSCKVGI